MRPKARNRGIIFLMTVLSFEKFVGFPVVGIARIFNQSLFRTD
jgi:hypothetical protein